MFTFDLLAFALTFAAGLATGISAMAAFDAVLDVAKARSTRQPEPLTQDDPATTSILRFGRMRDRTGGR
jgi:hypothetical protein